MTRKLSKCQIWCTFSNNLTSTLAEWNVSYNCVVKKTRNRLSWTIFFKTKNSLSHEIDLRADCLQRDHTPAWELNKLIDTINFLPFSWSSTTGVWLISVVFRTIDLYPHLLSPVRWRSTFVFSSEPSPLRVILLLPLVLQPSYSFRQLLVALAHTSGTRPLSIH